MLKFISLVEDYSFVNFVCSFRNELSEKVGGRPRASTNWLHFEHLPGEQCNCRNVNNICIPRARMMMQISQPANDLEDDDVANEEDSRKVKSALADNQPDTKT